MTELMRRRGPDDVGTWTDGEHVALGFRRLAILDLSPAGHQPMETPCGRHVLVFNGEVYNFRELRAELEASGHRFRSTSDTEVVLAALATWGESALARFNGMFALAWYDRRERCLRLARDPLGIKPLYYLDGPQGVVFGSQYDQVLRHPFCTRKIRRECLGLYLRLGYIPPPDALFEQTWLLPPGHLVRVEPGQSLTQRRFYELPEERDEFHDPEAVTEATEAAVRSAVRRQMVSDVPLGAFLSGGVDSPLVAAELRRVSEDVRAFTIGCTDARFDEAEVASAYAAALQLQQRADRFGPEECLSLIDESARAYSEPFADYSSFPSLLLCRSTREDVTVALSGDGGDELFFGYPRFWKISDQASSFRRPRALRVAAYLHSRASGGKLPSGVRFRDPGAWQFDGHCFSGLRDRELRALCGGELPLPAGFDLYRYHGPYEEKHLARWLRRNELSGHLQMVLLKMDRASMHYSLEVRVPLLDLEVVALAMRLPPEICMHDGLGKLPLRHALSRLVPPEQIPARKAGFSIPLGDWLRSELRPAIEALLLDGGAYPAGLFKPHVLRSLYQEHLQGRDRTRALWHLLALQYWAREHLRPAFRLDSC
jgi:asparagine synthase (glutamine-hydrolysing)